MMNHHRLYIVLPESIYQPKLVITCGERSYSPYILVISYQYLFAVSSAILTTTFIAFSID
mgnify:FL=1|jgi:hypothetical protein